ncbi:balbiani ring protein 3-like [Palaemon carinicauda]|uniref:balbiani ring protein 3-like n=1 Tax=Palaemon carinicauda TaxID=392227 RepID=UPI0035B5833A
MKTTFAAAIVLIVVLNVTATEGRDCHKSRKEKQHLQRIKKIEMPCSPPAQQLVPIPVPEGYDSVVPSVTIVKRCSELLCSEKKRCVATQNTTKYVKVELKFGDSSKCDYVGVEEHQECGCQCIVEKEHCKEFEEFDEDKCECRCTENGMARCLARGNAWTWHSSSCSCVSLVDGSIYK